MPVSHWEFLRQHQLTQLIKKIITQLGFKLFSSGIRQWGDNITITGAGYGASFEYPIVFPTKVLAVIPFDVNGGWADEAIPSVHAAWFPDEGSDGNDLRWARIGFSTKNTIFGAYRFVAIGK